MKDQPDTSPAPAPSGACADPGDGPAWRDELFPPLDIAQLARAITAEWLQAFADLSAGFDYRQKLAMRRGAGAVMDTVVEVLRAYDEGRTRHIAFLKSELVRLHNLMPGPPIVLPATERKVLVDADSIDAIQTQIEESGCTDWGFARDPKGTAFALCVGDGSRETIFELHEMVFGRAYPAKRGAQSVTARKQHR